MAANEVRVCFKDGSTVRGRLETADRPPWRLALSAPGVDSFETVADDLFEALREAASALETFGARVCCNGMRADVRPSSMARDAGGARYLYRLVLGRPVDTRDVVALWEPAPCDEVVTVSEQDRYYERYLASLEM